MGANLLPTSLRGNPTQPGLSRQLSLGVQTHRLPRPGPPCTGDHLGRNMTKPGQHHHPTANSPPNLARKLTLGFLLAQPCFFRPGLVTDAIFVNRLQLRRNKGIDRYRIDYSQGFFCTTKLIVKKLHHLVED